MKAVAKLNPVEGFKIITCTDGNIFLDKIEKKLGKNQSVLLGIPLRLGLHKITKEYLESIKQIFLIEHNVGIAGGADKKSFYF